MAAVTGSATGDDDAAKSPKGDAAKTRPGNVAVLVVTADGADRFTADYVAELVLAGAGGSGVYRSVPPELLAAHLERLGRTTTDCPSDDDCLRKLGGALDLHHVLVATLRGTKTKTTLEPVIVTIGTLAIARKPLTSVPGGDDAILGGSPGLGEQLAATPPLGLVRLDGPAGTSVLVDGIAVGTMPLDDGTLRLLAGAHDVRLEAGGRAAWSERLTLASGKRYVLRWK